MSGNLLVQARKDARKIINSGGFEEEIKLSNPSGVFSIIVNGLHSKHWLVHDTEGNLVNGKNAHITVSENELNEKGYQTRDSNTGNVNLRNHLVSVKDATGVEKNYIIKECFPSETFGLIVCVLGDYKKL